MFSVLFFDRIKIDDPVGATSVHLVCGIFGTLCVGLFTTTDLSTSVLTGPFGTAACGGPYAGLFFGGGTKLDFNSINTTPTTASVDPLRINETKVVDAVGQDGLAGTVARKLVEKGWNVVTASNSSTGLVAEKTVIYINSDQLNDAAKALTGDLGNYSIEVSNQYIDPITVVLGADYK